MRDVIPVAVQPPVVPLELSSILIVQQDASLRESWRLLLGSLQHPVLALGAYREVVLLSAGSNCRLVVLDIAPSEHEAQKIAAHARRAWPVAKILLLGHPSEYFDDPLYDDAVDSYCNPAGVLECARRLLRVDDVRTLGRW